METDLNRKTGDCPSFMGEVMDASADKSPTTAVPSEGYAKKSSLGGATVAGRATEKWSCSGGQGVSGATQWHDPKFQFMLKEETSDGDVMEFYELSETSFAASLLETPKGMKRVSAEEFRNKMFGGMLPSGDPGAIVASSIRRDIHPFVLILVMASSPRRFVYGSIFLTVSAGLRTITSSLYVN